MTPRHNPGGWGLIPYWYLPFLIFIYLTPALLDEGEPLFAQPLVEDEEPAEKSPKELPRVHVTPSLYIAGLYNDNILLRSIRRESDYITRVRPGFSVALSQERVQWLNNLAVEFEFYREHPELSTFNRSQSFDTRLIVRPTPRWTFEFSDAFVHSLDPAERVELGLVFDRTEFYANTIWIKGAYRMTSRLTGEAEFIDRITEFTREELVNFRSDELKTSLVYRMTPVDTAAAQYRFRIFDFEDRGRTFANTVSGRVDHRFTDSLTAWGMIGLIFVYVADRPDGEEISKTDFLLGMGVDQAYSQTIAFHLDFLRDINVVGGVAGTFAVNTLTGTATAHLTQALDWINSFRASIQQSQLISRADLYTVGFKTDVQYKVTQWLRTFLSYEFFLQDYQDRLEVYNNRIFVGLTASQTYPRRP